MSDGSVIQNVQDAASIADAVVSANDLAASAAELVMGINQFLEDEDAFSVIADIINTVQKSTVSTSTLLEENLLLIREVLVNTESFTERMEILLAENDASVGRSIQNTEQAINDARNILASLQTVLDDVQYLTNTTKKGARAMWGVCLLMMSSIPLC